MLLYVASEWWVYASHSASGRKAYYIRSGIRANRLCFFMWHPGGKFMLPILPPGGKLIIQDHVSGRIACLCWVGYVAFAFIFGPGR